MSLGKLLVCSSLLALALAFASEAAADAPRAFEGVWRMTYTRCNGQLLESPGYSETLTVRGPRVTLTMGTSECASTAAGFSVVRSGDMLVLRANEETQVTCSKGKTPVARCSTVVTTSRDETSYSGPLTCVAGSGASLDSQVFMAVNANAIFKQESAECVQLFERAL